MSATRSNPEELPPDFELEAPTQRKPVADDGGSQNITSTDVPADTAKEDEPMVHVHPAPHAATSWKDFFVHIVTIVVGLLIAIALEQTVEYFHHRHQLADLRQELRSEREANKELFKAETAHWRWEAVELQNNLMVLNYLQHHPGTPDDKLPGALVWFHASAPHTEAVWDAARSGTVITLMPREEIEQYEDTYSKLNKIDEARSLTWDAMNDASRYELTNKELSELTPTQVSEVLALTQIALTKHWLEGVALENAHRDLKDFPPSITSDELSRVRNRKTVAEGMKDAPYALTISRMKAAGYEP